MARTANRYSSKTTKRTGDQANGRSNNRAARRAAGRTPVVETDIHAVLGDLLAMNGNGSLVVSCYQKLEPKDRNDKKYRIKLKNRVRVALERAAVLGYSHDEREIVRRSLEQIESFFDFPGNLTGARGVAVFAGEKLFRAVLLPQVLRSRIMVDRTPVVSELVAITESGTRVLVVIADRTSGRIFDVSLAGVTEIEGVVPPRTPSRPGKFHPDRDSAPGIGEFRFHTRIREERQRHLEFVATETARAFRRQPYDAIVIGGAGVDADALLPFLDTPLRDRVIGTLKLAPKMATASEIGERAFALLSDAAEAAAADAVGEVVALRETGWATDGIEATLQALAIGQVRTLVVDHDAEIPGYRFPKSHRLSTIQSGTRAEGEPEPVVDLLDDAIEEALRQRARVAVVTGEETNRFDQLAGVLRFRMNSKKDEEGRRATAPGRS